MEQALLSRRGAIANRFGSGEAAGILALVGKSASAASVATVVCVVAMGCGRLSYAGYDGGDGTDSPPGLDATDDGSLDGAIDAGPTDGTLPTDGGTDAEASDGGGTDGGSADAGPPCMRPTTRFCDGFDVEPFIPPWEGTIIETGGSIARSSTRVVAGGGALRAETVRSNASSFIYVAFPEIATGDVYVRAFYHVGESPVLGHLDLLEVVSTTGTQSFGLNIIDGALIIYDGGAMAPAPTTGSYTLPTDRFFCLELRVGLDAAAGSVEVWADDVSVVRGEGIPTLGGGAYDFIRTGVSYAGSAQPSAIVYVDEIVVAAERIGCAL